MKPVILIPAFKPDQEILPGIIDQIRHFDIEQMIVVDDGSGPEYEAIFHRVSEIEGVLVLRHDQNKGKGAALRTGIRHVLDSNTACSAVITVDADGQHLPRDVEAIIGAAQKFPDALVLGARDLKGQIPLRSWLGNKITGLVFRGFIGQNIKDTQTGLRAIPFSFLERVANLRSDRYAYELEMLLTLIQEKRSITEVDITTVYEDQNQSSSFNPISDSIQIYITLFRWWAAFRFMQMVKYSFSGILATIADFGMYILLIDFSFGIATASIAARAISILIHFTSNKYFTFSYKEPPTVQEIIKYLMVVVFNLSASIGLIYGFVTLFHIGEISAKVAAQLLLFISTYTLLNGFVFLKKRTNRPA